jgi:hypothetical protein
MPFFENTEILLRDVQVLDHNPYFNNGNQNPFYIELTKTDGYYRECLHGQPGLFTVGNINSKYDRRIFDSKCRADGSTIVSSLLYHIVCILVPSSAKSRKILVQHNRNKGEHTLSNRQVNFILYFMTYLYFIINIFLL